jgi:hypothetical protein
MKRPEVGEQFEAYFGERLITATVVEWRGRRCYFDNGYYLVWGGEHIGFLLWR